MSFENKITDKLSEASMLPSSDIMSMVRKKRTPFYIFRNHLKLHKVRYGAVAVLGLLALSAPFVLDTNNNAETVVVVDNEKSHSTILKSEDNSKGKSSMKEEKASEFNAQNKVSNEQKESQVPEELKETSSIALSTDNENNDKGTKSNVKDRNNKTIDALEGKVEENVNAQEKGEIAVNSGEVAEGNDTENNTTLSDERKLRELERQELVQSERISVPMANLEYLENSGELVDRSVEDYKPDGSINDLRKIGVTFIGVGAGYYYDNNVLSGGAMGDKMKESLGASNSTSYGLSIGLSLYKKWTLQTGVEVLTRKEEFSYLKKSENYILKIDTVKGKIHIPGEPDKDVVRYDSSYYNDGKHKRYTAINKTSYVELPFVFSYNILSNQRLKVGVNPGLRVGLLQTQSGLTLNETYSPVNINSEGKINQHRSINFNAEIGLDFDYKLAPRVNFFLQPKIRRGLGNLMDDKADFSKNNTSFGVFSGIRFQLN